MTIIIGGKTNNTGADVETTFQALRMTSRPNDFALSPYAGSGFFSLGIDNGPNVMAASGLQTDSEIFQWMWSDPTAACVIRSIRMTLGTVVAFAAGRLKIDLFMATQYTEVGTGGSNPDLSIPRCCLKRSSLPPTQMGAVNIRIANTSALTPGIRVLDNQPLQSWAAAAPATIGPVDTQTEPTLGMIQLWQRFDPTEYPLVLNRDEGFVIRATTPGTGTWYFGVNVEWYEADARLTYG